MPARIQTNYSFFKHKKQLFYRHKNNRIEYGTFIATGKREKQKSSTLSP